MSGSQPLSDTRILLIIGGGIAAYKALDLIRRLKERGAAVRCIMTRAATEFVTPLSAASLSGERVFTDMFSLTDESDIGHIALSRWAHLIIVAPATADLLAKMAAGLANDLASTALMATDKPVLIAPAMNPRMWMHAATQRNMAQLRADGIATVGPNAGLMAERGEEGPGRMAEPLEIVAAAEQILAPAGPLKGQHVLITSGPTYEPIDPVRYIANRSSGKQGHALAAAAAAAGARVTLVTGPVNLPDPPGVNVVKIETARQMLEAVEAALPVDIAIFAAAVADWRVEAAGQKLKKGAAGPPALQLSENPDILATIAHRKTGRPRLVVGFAAETQDVIPHARAKLARKGCDLIVANDVGAASGIAGGVMGGELNAVHLVSAGGVDSWPELSKAETARRLIAHLATLQAR